MKKYDKMMDFLDDISGLPITAEMLCIRWHMGAFDDKENWNSYGRAVTNFPNVLYTHTADMIAARILGV